MMPAHPPLMIRPKVESSLQASKWLTCPVLLDDQEMRALLEAMGEFWIFLVSGLLQQSEGFVEREAFLNAYGLYVNSLKKGEYPDDRLARTYFSTVLTTTVEALYEVPLANQRKLIKVERPVIQLQSHRFDYSAADGKFRSMVLGRDSVQWGIQFSYPQLYQDASFQVKAVRDNEEFPNTALFKRLQKWMRAYTTATPFFVDGKRINVPIRLGKQCFAWINRHPQLKPKGLSILAGP